MGLLVEYALQEGKTEAQHGALATFVDGLKAEGCDGFSYTAYATDDPLKFIAVLEFVDEDAKQRFLSTDAFAHYRDTAKDRFTGPPSTTAINRVASTLD